VPGTEGMIDAWLFPAAIVTIALGAFGVLGAKRLMPLISFSVVGSMGTLLVAVAVFSPVATTAALYYMVHSTFAAACLFLIADLVVSRRSGDSLTPTFATVQNGLFAAIFFAAAIAMAGMPPLSGFLGKLLVLDALRGPDVIVWAWTAILVGSLLTIVGFARAGSALFWKSTEIEAPLPDADGAAPHNAATVAQVTPVMLTLAVLVALAVFAGPVATYLEQTSAQLFDRSGYISAVLAPVEES
jgi:multicomponent K+:H+ antiporter subunit D